MIKYLKIIIVFCFFIFSVQIVNAQRNTIHYSEINCNNDSIKCSGKLVKTVKIYDIKKEKNVYIIYTSDPVRLSYGYVILSKKNKNNKLTKLEVGKEYKFYLIPYLDLDMKTDYEETNYVYVRGGPHFIFYLNVEGTIIRFDSDGENNFYGSPNLQGLYYVPYDGTEQDKEYPYFRSHANWVKYDNVRMEKTK